MENSRLVQLLRTFSKEEWRGLKKLVRSPFFNQRPEVVALLDWLETSWKNNLPAPDKTSAFRTVFGDKDFDDHRLRMAMSFLYQCATQYLTVSHFQADTPQTNLLLARLLRERKLPELARQLRQASAEAIQRQALRNADFQQQQYEVFLEQYRAEMDANPTGPLPLQALSDQLDRAFLCRKLWQSCFMLSHLTVYNTQYDFGLLEAALTHLADSPALEEPGIALYFHCYQALIDPGQKAHFQEFKHLLLTHGAHFPEGELRDLYVLAINFCIRQYNAGNPEYLAEQFDFYQEGLAKQYFLVEGQLSRYTYQNAATVGLLLDQLEWVDTFIHAYRGMLPPPYRESLFSFNLARLEYRRRRLDEALRLLQKAEYKDVLLHLAARTLQLKIFYETGEHDLLESHLQALQTFIRRKKGLGYHRENYLNTIFFTRKLLESNLYDKSVRQALRAEMESTKAVAEKEWLLLQIDRRR